MPLKVVSLKDNMQGVITTTDINKGSLVYQFKKLSYIKAPTRTSIQVGPEQHVEDILGRYLNHNCNPNIKITGDNKNIKLIAIKNILKTQEITFDYNSTEWRLTCPFRCNCHGTLITGRYYKEVQNGQTS